MNQIQLAIGAFVVLVAYAILPKSVQCVFRGIACGCGALLFLLIVNIVLKGLT